MRCARAAAEKGEKMSWPKSIGRYDEGQHQRDLDPKWFATHTFASRLRANGVHEMDIMTLLGHTTLQMTSRYTHAMPQNLRTAVDSLKQPAVGFSCEKRAKIAPTATGTDGLIE